MTGVPERGGAAAPDGGRPCVECGGPDASLRSRLMRRTTWFCGRCWRVRHGELNTLAIMVLVPMMVASAGDPVRALSFPLAVVVALVVHEVAHALCAAAVGFPVIRIQLGGGRPLLRTRIAGAEIVVSRRFMRGYTAYRLVDRRLPRARRIAVALSGAAANVAVAVAAVGLAPARIRFALVAMNGFFAVRALWPFSRKLHNDGRAVVAVATCPRWLLDAGLLHPHFAAAKRHLDEREIDQALAAAEEALRLRPDNPVALNVLGTVLVAAGRAGEARALYLRILGRPRIDRIRRALLNNLAYADLLLGDPALLKEAVEASAEALGGGDEPAFLDTRAWALIESGQVAAGLRLAQRVLTTATGRDRAHTQCLLALAAARSADRARADDLLRTASGVLGEADPVLCRIRAAVADTCHPGHEAEAAAS